MPLKYLLAPAPLLLLLPLWAHSLWAHHGTGASYDQNKSVPIKGTVTQFIWRNPHSALFLDVKEGGKTVSYTIEMYSPGLMVKQGYKRDSFKPGDQVEVHAHPSLAGEPVGECLGCKVVINGKDMGGKQK